MTDSKRDSNTPPASQTPLKDLHLARVMFRKLREKIITWQNEEYDDEILDYLKTRESYDEPFPEDFSADPDNIQQIKNFTNALYLAEEAFNKCGNLNITTVSTAYSTLDLKLIKEAYEACHLLLNLAADVESNFRQEINFFASGLASLISHSNNPTLPYTPFKSHDVGLTVGRAIKQGAPTSDQNGYDLLSYFGAVFPAYPSYIETLRVTIEKQTSRNPEHAPNINKEKMEQLVEQGKKLNKTIASSNQNSLYFIFNLISLIRQTHTLWTEIYQEAGELNGTLQSLGREYLALLKYELLPAIFHAADKLEIQLMLKPGRLSKPLMEQIKPWHEGLVQAAKSLITFDETNEQLLKLEDTQFIALRLKPIQQKIEHAKAALHLIDPALAALKIYLDNPTKDSHAGLEKHILALTPYMLDTDKTLIDRVNNHIHEATNWYDYITDWYNYITINRQSLKNNPSDSNIKHTLLQLEERWKQLKPNHAFKLERYNAQADSIQDNAHRVLFPRSKNSRAFQVSEQETLENAYLSSEKIIYQKEGDDTYAQHPQKLSTSASWVLYRSYEEKLEQLERAKDDCKNLIKALSNQDPPWKGRKLINFKPPYKHLLLDGDVLHQPKNIYFKMSDDLLQYEVLEPTNKPCMIYLMTLEEAVDAGHRGYIWNHDQNQLSYITEDGTIQSKITLSNIGYLIIFLKGQKSKLGKNNELQLNEKSLMETITSQGHHPGIIHKASIPLTELGCSLTELKTIEQLTPYLSHIFNEALERGHIQDEFKTKCIKWYGSIQPYIHNKSLDERFTRLFSGSFLKNTPKNAPNIRHNEAETAWRKIEAELSGHIEKLKEKRDEHALKCKNKTFILPPEPDNKLKHREFLPDTAKFMPSVEPIKRQIHNSKKTCFRIELALDYLKAYKPSEQLKKADYPWFQSIYVGSLSQATVSQITEQLNQTQAYEALQIKRNEQLEQKSDVHSSVKANAKLSEKDAFTHFRHAYEPVVMQEDIKPSSGELQLKVENNQLHYKFIHYGKELNGIIDLNLIKPLTSFDKKTIITNDVLERILGFAYMERQEHINKQIGSNPERLPEILSPDEALDLYLWLENKPKINQKNLENYEFCAKRKPALIESTQENSTPENRSDHLIKHTMISESLGELKHNVFEHFGSLNASLKKELRLGKSKVGLPYPEVGAQNGLIDLLKDIMNVNLISVGYKLNQQLEPDHLSTLENPQQVLLLKRLMNVIYYLEQIVLEIEKINEKSYQVPYVMHLVISYLYVQDIMPLLSELAKDPVFSTTHAGIIDKVETISNMLKHESNYYLETSNAEDKEKNKQTTLHSILNTLKMLPVRLSSSTAQFEAQRPTLKKATQKSVRNIEMILKHYNSSWSYLLLLLDLPTIQHLLNDMRHDFEGLLKHSHEATLENLSALNTEYLAKIILEADKLENNLGLKAGLISEPLQEILDEFYQGLITPLTPKVDQQIKLLCGDNRFITERIKAVEARKKSAQTSLVHYNNASYHTMQNLLDACEETQKPYLLFKTQSVDVTKKQKGLKANFDYILSGGHVFYINDHADLISLTHEESALIIKSMTETEKPNKYTVKPFELAISPIHSPQKVAYERLNTAYKETLPTLKASLNSSDVHLLSIQEAQQKELQDCFVFDEQKSQLYHLDAEGELNPQTGCRLFLRSIPAHKEKPEHLDHQTNMLHPHDPDKTGRKIHVKHPTLVQHGEKYYIYANADNKGWKYTELDAEVIADMKLNFSRIKPLDIHQKYQDMYNEIATKTKLIYPIHLKNTFKAISFLTKKKESSENTEKLYLSEHAISEYITSNSDFALQKHGVSIKPGCCLISLTKIPTDFYELELPAGFNSYYAQIGSNTDVLYYIDTATRSITPLPVEKLPTPAGQDLPSEIKILKDTRKNKIFDAHDFENIKALTGHTCDASIMIDVNNFKPDTQSFDKLHALAKRSQAYYQGMINTSTLAEATANEQLAYLKQLKDEKNEKDTGIKQELYTDYFENKAHELAQDKSGLQGYKLCRLKDKTWLKTNCLYIKIQGDAIHYRVINPAGKYRGTSIKLSDINWPENRPIDSESIDRLIPYLPAILKETSKKGDGHTRPHALADDYRIKLTQALFNTEDATVAEAILSEKSEVIDKALAVQKKAFDNEHLEYYKQLDAINQAVGEFRLYLKRTKKAQSHKHISCFEKADTLESKKTILSLIDIYSSEASKSPKERIEAIQEYLQAPETSDALMAYHTYESTSFESLLQCMFRLLEAAGLYTPEMTQRLDKIVNAVQQDDTKLSPANNRFRFFPKATREKIQEKTQEKILKPKPSDTTPEM